MDREAKAWKCKHCGGAMGVVMRNGSGIRQLLLYRWALAPNPSPINGRGEEEGPEVMAVVEGYVADVRCSICGQVRTWVPGPEEIRKMIKRYNAETQRTQRGY